MEESRLLLLLQKRVYTVYTCMYTQTKTYISDQNHIGKHINIITHNTAASCPLLIVHWSRIVLSKSDLFEDG